jgi:1,4-alpha-glucan branching enzyme
VSLKKQYLKARPVCKVTFSLPKEAADSVRTVQLVGDFNEWNINATPMKRMRNGAFEATLSLSRNMEYQFRYLLDGQRWENDWEADKYVPNAYGSENSVVDLKTL